MRRILQNGISILLSFSMLFPVAGGVLWNCNYSVVSAAEYTDESTKYVYTVENNKANIIRYEGEGTSLTIPSTIGGYAVEGIGDEAFKENQEVTSVIISEGISTIGISAFQSCENLQSVQIPSTITVWKEDSSYNNSAFEGCTGLTELTLAEDLSTLGQRAFAGCTALEKVRIPSGITSFKDQVFAACTKLAELELAEGIREMGYQAFINCSALTSVTIPSTIENWGLVHTRNANAGTHGCQAFKYCTLLSEIHFTEGLQTLAEFQGIANCPLITEIDVPESVKNISYGFSNCENLKKITLHEGIEEIGESAFSACTALEEIWIPKSVTSISYNTTQNCKSLKAIYILNTTLSMSESLYWRDGAKIYCIAGSAAYKAYKSKMGTKYESQLYPFPEIEGLQVQGYSAVWDDMEHDAVTLTGTREGDEILYRVDGGKFQAEVPSIKEIGSYTVDIDIRRREEGDAIPQISYFTVKSEVQGKTPVIQLKDMEVKEGEDYEVIPEAFEGDGEIVYNYYEDEALKKKLAGKPTAPGVYYVQGTVEKAGLWSAGKSNVAKIVILGTAPTETPDISPDPTPGSEPAETPGATPDATPAVTPNVSPSAAPTVTPDTEPIQKPGDSQQVTVKKVTLKKVKSPGKKTMEVSWKKAVGVTGYEIWIAQNNKFTKGKKSYIVKSNKTVKKQIKKLKSKTKYYVKVRAYQVVDGKTYDGKFSAVKPVRIK